MQRSGKLSACARAENLKRGAKMKIITLTLNPAFDMHCFVSKFRPYHENIAEIQSLEAGGKGVNISRALTKNGVENLAAIVVGSENCSAFERQLQADNLTYKLIKTPGRIRENITLHSGDGADETRISFHGFTCDKSVLGRVSESVGKVEKDTAITLTGSIPDGVSVNDVKALLENFRSCGKKIVIDSRSFTMADLAEFRPWLIKPNEDEASAYLKMQINTPQDGLAAAKKLQSTGIKNVLLSLGGKGAALANENGVFFASAPKIGVVSTIGAGDSMIAGFLSGYVAGKNHEECLRRAVAFGSAACLRAGTQPPLPEDVAKLEAKITAEKI